MSFFLNIYNYTTPPPSNIWQNLLFIPCSWCDDIRNIYTLLTAIMLTIFLILFTQEINQDGISSILFCGSCGGKAENRTPKSKTIFQFIFFPK